MRRFKRLFSAIIVILLVFNFSVSVFAQETEEIRYITINAKDYSDYTPTQMRSLLQKTLKGGNIYLTLIGKFEVYGSKLNYYSNTTIDATKATVTQTKIQAGLFRNISQGNGGYEDLYNVTILGGKWVCQYKGSGSGGYSTFVFSHATNVTVKDATFLNCYNGHHIEVAGCKNVVIQNCQFKGTYKGPGEQEAIQLETCREGFIGGVVFDDTACNGVLIEDCYFKFPKSVGCHRAVEGHFTKNVTIKNCEMKTKHEGINAFCIVGFTATGNVINGGTMGISFKTYAPTNSSSFITDKSNKTAVEKDYKINISNNTINNCSSFAIHLIGNSTRKIKNVTVKNNQVTSVRSYGVYAEYLVNASFSKNKIKDIKTGYIHGVYANRCKNINFTSNTVANITGSGARGIFVNNTKTSVIKSNKISNTEKEGIAVTYSSVKNEIKSNKITNVRGTGIYTLHSSGLDVQKNTIKKVKYNGITINSISNSPKVVSNSIKDTGRYGIYVVTSAKTTVKKNVINDTAKRGIHIINAEKSNIESNTISDYNGSGIYCQNYNKSITIKDNVCVCNNKENKGIFLTKVKNATVSGNTIRGSKCIMPIYVAKKSTANIKTFNKFSMNTIYDNSTTLGGKVASEDVKPKLLYNDKVNVKVTISGKNWVSRTITPKTAGKTFTAKITDNANNVFSITKTVKKSKK